MRAACGLMLAAAALSGCNRGEAGQAAGRPTPSGFPVPRYVSLKFDEVNARAGPGDDYRALWTYRVRGLPLQVIAETRDWRRICDPDGQVAWVHQRTVDTRRMVIRKEMSPVDIRRGAADTDPIVARLAGRSLAGLDSCEAGWCEVEAGGVKGWLPQAAVWGADEAVQCAPPPPGPPR